MEIQIDQTRWYDRVWAAFIFFTRLPFWRLHEPPRECFKTVVEHWPLTGWLTASMMGLTLWLGSAWLPWTVTVVVAITVRLLLTGALHEDGLADFIDGFGGGRDRQRILDIMKDSRIGTYGVLGLTLYSLLLFTALSALSPTMAALTICAADPFAKMVTAQLVMMMPYARKESESKAQTVYRKISWRAAVSLAVQGLLPLGLFVWYTGLSWEPLVFLPCLVMYLLYLLIWNRLHGYTGDCCGAVCLLVELTFVLVACALVNGSGA